MQLDPDILEAIFTNEGQDLKTLSEQSPILLVFLRHFGCTFCRETLSDIAVLRPLIEQSNIQIVLVHMADEHIATEYLAKAELPNVPHISDPDLSLYEFFGLSKGSFWQLYGLKTWVRGFKVGVLDGHGGVTVDSKLGDFTQMPGIFLVQNCQIREKFIHRSAADHADYCKIINAFLAKNHQPPICP